LAAPEASQKENGVKQEDRTAEYQHQPPQPRHLDGDRPLRIETRDYHGFYQPDPLQMSCLSA
jgi:hypothetical protein